MLSVRHSFWQVLILVVNPDARGSMSTEMENVFHLVQSAFLSEGSAPTTLTQRGCQTWVWRFGIFHLCPGYLVRPFHRFHYPQKSVSVLLWEQYLWSICGTLRISICGVLNTVCLTALSTRKINKKPRSSKTAGNMLAFQSFCSLARLCPNCVSTMFRSPFSAILAQ